ncbi:DUF4270 domain-containing protein [Flavobacterium sp.]|uniref:DUF4270 domain-containing protein n=1 Tax=Flavobacterium sp. TaxID=239 RepID=UPI0037532A89
MKFNFLLKTFVVGFLIVLCASCDKDFNEVGTDIVGGDHYNINKEDFNVVAYNQNLYGGTQTVQSNNLPVNSLGFYDNAPFGQTKASFVTQLELAAINPTFYKTDLNDIIVDSVYMHVPYFSTLESVDATSGDGTFTLDSISGGTNKISLNIYRSGFFLANLDPNAQLLEPQKYYANQQQDFNNNQVQLLASEPEFEFKTTQIKFFKTTTAGALTTDVRERLSPGLYFDLDTAYFKNNIIKAGAANLVNNNAFKDYFRGLYFKVNNAASSTTQGTLARLNFTQGKITIVYRDAKSATDQTTLVRKTMVLNMTGNTVNLLENTYANPITPDVANGDSKIYLKGGQGSMSVIKLFDGKSNNASPDLTRMRQQKWLINDASLTFYIDKSAMPNQTSDASTPFKNQPNRIYLYDLRNNRPLIDYYTDLSTSASGSKFNKLVHGGIIEKETSGTVTKYKVRITNYIRSLVKNGGNTDVTKDSTNVMLGLVVTENIGNVSNMTIKNAIPYQQVNKTGTVVTRSLKLVPSMSVANPLGTVLYGSNLSVGDVNYDKRIKLEIYYTKPD